MYCLMAGRPLPMTGRGNLWTLPTGHFPCICISGLCTCLSFIITGRLKSLQEVYCKHPLLIVTTAEESLKHRENPTLLGHLSTKSQSYDDPSKLLKPNTINSLETKPSCVREVVGEDRMQHRHLKYRSQAYFSD
jgi:hypothetical protein